MTFASKYDKEKDILFNTFSKAPYGTKFSYKEITDIIGLDSIRFRYIVLHAQKRLEETASKTLKNDYGSGYIIAEPTEHLMLAKKQHSQAKRKLKRSYSIIHATDRSALSPEDLQRIESVELSLVEQREAIRRLNKRTAILEKKHTKVNSTVQTLSERINEALNRIESLESKDILFKNIVNDNL